MKILITGGLGFIGANSALYFGKNGYDVTVFDNFSRAGAEKNLEFLKSEIDVEVVRGDISTDFDMLKDLMEKVDVVLHLAAQVAVTTSVQDPRDDFMTNALGSFNVLEAIRVSKKRPIALYSSTNKVYGELNH